MFVLLACFATPPDYFSGKRRAVKAGTGIVCRIDIRAPAHHAAIHTKAFSGRSFMSATTLRMVFAAQALALLLGVGQAGAADLNPAALVYKAPDQLKWRDPTGAAGINQAVL